MTTLALTASLVQAPVVDPRTGALTPLWQRFFTALYQRVGQGVAPGNDVLDTRLAAVEDGLDFGSLAGAVGLLVRSSGGTFTGRTLQPGSARLTVTHGDGLAGNPVLDVVEGALTVTEAQVPGLLADLAARLLKANNLSDLTNVPAARSHLGLGALATQHTVTQAQVVGLVAALAALAARLSTLETHRWEPLVSGEPGTPELIFAGGELIWEFRPITD